MQGKTLARATVILVCLAVSTMAAAQFGCGNGRLPAAGKPAPAPTPNPQDMVEVRALLGKVNEALGRAEQQLKGQPQHPTLDSVSLALQTVAVDQGGGTVKFFIFQFGSQTTTALTSKITLTLGKPKAGTVPPAAKGLRRPPDLASNLADAIVAAWQAEKQGRDAIPGLQPKNVGCEISFSVKREDNGGLALVLAPISIDAGRTASLQTIQTITVTFGT